MDEAWVTQTVEDIRASGQTREQAVEASEETYRQNNLQDLEAARELCLACVEAVVDAALE